MSIIDKTYVINLKERSDRWKRIKEQFSNTNLNLTRWDAVYGKKLPNHEYKQKTTPMCYEFCSPSMVGCWLSHVSIWKNIIKNNETNVLILEDDAYPTNNFNEKLKKIWKQVPEDWDFIFLGSYGSCQESVAQKLLYNIISGHKNNPVYKFGKKQPNVIIPGFPLALHGYILSMKGAKKLLNNYSFDKAKYHIDYYLAKYVFPDKNFNVYAISPALIFQNLASDNSDIQMNNHPIISYVSDKFNKNKNSHTIDSSMSTVLTHVRRLNLSVTVFMCILIVLSFLIGFGSTRTHKYYYIIILALYCSELIYGTKIKSKLRGILIELFMVYIFLQFGKYIKIFIRQIKS